jgi:alpha-ketoglutarate-dependent taurine dioxygenase
MAGTLQEMVALDESFVRTAADASADLPRDVVDALARFRGDSGPDGVLLLRGLAVGDVPATPAHPSDAIRKDRTSEHTLLSVASVLGEPVGYVQEHGGGIVQNIVPSRDTEGRQVSTSSAVTLAWHTETAFHPHKPRYLLLLCLRGDPHAATMLCSVAHCLPHLDSPTVAILREPRFRTRPDESFLAPGAHGRLGPPTPVLAGGGEVPTLNYDEDLMVGVDAVAQAALERLGSVVRERASALVLAAGDLLVVDNARVVHGRSPFDARFDGTDRWLQRAFVVEQLEPSAGERRGRIITTTF